MKKFIVHIFIAQFFVLVLLMQSTMSYGQMPIQKPTVLVLSPSEILEKARDAERNRNYTEAVKLYRKSADQGNSEAQYMLVNMYWCGAGVPVDDADAVKWYRKSADQGYPGVQLLLGWIYEDGLDGVPKDDSEALMWYQRALDNGDPDAEEKIKSLKAKMNKLD